MNDDLTKSDLEKGLLLSKHFFSVVILIEKQKVYLEYKNTILYYTLLINIRQPNLSSFIKE